MKERNYFKEYIPLYCEGKCPEEFFFDSKEELFSSSLFERTRKIEGFDDFYLNGNDILWSADKRDYVWVMGTVRFPERLEIKPYIRREITKDYKDPIIQTIKSSLSTVNAYFEYLPVTGTEEIRKYFNLLEKDLFQLKEELVKTLKFLELDAKIKHDEQSERCKIIWKPAIRIKNKKI